jgi:hypothetical protein
MERAMADVLFIGMFVLLSFILTADSLNKLRVTRKWMYAVAAAAGALGMMTALLDPFSSLVWAVLTIACRIVAGRMK